MINIFLGTVIGFTIALIGVATGAITTRVEVTENLMPYVVVIKPEYEFRYEDESGWWFERKIDPAY